MVFRLILIICFSFNVSAQPYFKWAKQIRGTNGTDVAGGAGITCDRQGNVYTIGSFNGVVDFNPSPADFTISAQNGAFISKLDAIGNFIWAKAFIGTGACVARAIFCDSLGEIYVTGTFQGNVDFDPGPGSYTLTSLGADDIFITKINSAGNLIWVKSIQGPSSEISTSLQVDKNGNVYTVGVFYGTSDFDPGVGTYTLQCSGGSSIFISKFDNSGNLIWAENIGNDISYSVANSLALDSLGNLYATGSFFGTLDFDPGPGVNALSTYNNNTDNCFILKLDPNGAFIWARELRGTNSTGNAITADFSGNIYTTGYFSGTIDFDPNSGMFYLTATPLAGDVFISKLDQEGNFIWATKIGGKNNESVFSICTDFFGRVYIGGGFQDTVDFNPGQGTYNLTSLGANDGFVLVLDSSGQFYSAKKVGGPINDFVQSVFVNQNMDVYSTGSFGYTANFNTDGGIFNLVSSGNSDGFVHKMSASVQGIQEFIGGSGLQIFPNPTSGDVFVTSVSTGKIDVIDCLGQRVIENLSIQDKTIKLDFRCMNQGVYFVHFSNSMGKTVYKIVVD